MKVWLVSSPKRYHVLLFHLINELINARDTRIDDFQNVTELEAIHFMRGLLVSEYENSIELTLIVDGDQTTFLTELHQLIVRCPYNQQALRIVIFSNLTSWTECYPSTGISDLGGYFIARKPPPGQAESYRVENCFSQLEAQRKVRANLILLGLLYGGDGQDFKPILRQIWDGNLTTELLTGLADRTVPLIHYQRFLSLITSILFQLDHSYGFIVSAFDWEIRPLRETVETFHRSINYDTNQDALSLSNSDFIISSFLEYDVSNIVNRVKLHPESNSPLIEQSFSHDWKNFLDLAGLKPVSVLVTGAPKSGKTNTAKALSQSLQLAYVDVPESVVSLLRYDSSTVILAPGVDVTKVLEYQQDLKSFVEAKLQEGKKPGKDKNATDPLPIDYSLLNESFCLGIPPELLRKAVSYSLSSNKVVSRKGFILDIWEKSVLESIQDVHHCRSLLFKGNENVALDIIVEITSTEKSIMDKQIEFIGPANMKSKDTQAVVKALESQLAAYFSSVIETTNSEMKSHRKIIEYESAQSGSCIVIRRDFAGIDYSNLTEEIVSTIRTKNGRGFGWLPFDKTKSKELGPEIIAAGESEDTNNQENLESVTTVTDSNFLIEKENSLTFATSPGIAKIDEFLNVTLLPVLAKGLIEAVRQKPHDPVQYVANYLAEVSQKQQQEAYISAKKQFEDLLISS